MDGNPVALVDVWGAESEGKTYDGGTKTGVTVTAVDKGPQPKARGLEPETVDISNLKINYTKEGKTYLSDLTFTKSVLIPMNLFSEDPNYTYLRPLTDNSLPASMDVRGYSRSIGVGIKKKGVGVGEMSFTFDVPNYFPSFEQGETCIFKIAGAEVENVSKIGCSIIVGEGTIEINKVIDSSLKETLMNCKYIAGDGSLTTIFGIGYGRIEFKGIDPTTNEQLVSIIINGFSFGTKGLGGSASTDAEPSLPGVPSKSFNFERGGGPKNKNDSIKRAARIFREKRSLGGYLSEQKVDTLYIDTRP
ncbi:hypothetical protein [Marinilabilia sp.]|uniref:hypothetical protein n=1 Tax=Marinilabilia sp. TaxID=2021252 RepID=UPI0025C063A1|nr:hypothetical protein [Marinilabilia sp.]